MPDTRREKTALQALHADNTAGDISAQDNRDGWETTHPANTCQTAALATGLTSPITGDILLPSDGVWLERYNGSAGVAWGPLYPLTKPVSGDFAWINQGGASIVTTQGGVYLTDSAGAAAHNWRIRKKAAPSAPYTVTLAFTLVWDWDVTSSNLGYFGVGWRQSSDGKLVTCHLAPQPQAGAHNIYAQITKWNTETSHSADYTSRSIFWHFSPVIFVRLQDDNTNRIVSVSPDGQNWLAVHSVGRTDFMTADEVFFGVNCYSMAAGFHLLSWKEA